jgi:hypothetical protein
MQKARMALAVFAVIPLAFGACVSKSEYMKTVESANALEVDNARLRTELTAAGKRNDQLTADRAELERLLAARSGSVWTRSARRTSGSPRSCPTRRRPARRR